MKSPPRRRMRPEGQTGGRYKSDDCKLCIRLTSAGHQIDSESETAELIGKVRTARHTFRKIRLRYSIHTGMKQTAVKLTE